VSVQGGVSGSSSEVLSVFEWNMLSVTGLVALSQTKINNVDSVFGGFSSSSHEVVWLDVSVDDSFIVDYLNSLEHLNRNVQDSGEVKFSSALLEKILKRFAELVHDHNVVSLAILSFLISNEM
jgi:putative lipase involved disintegration of autophagic bodies